MRHAEQRAESRGFTASCEQPVGELLATLAVRTPHRGRDLELGSGCGVGTAWLAYGLDDRRDVELVTVERDSELASQLAQDPPAAFVDVVAGDAEQKLPDLGVFDLIFADAEGGKWTGLDLTLDALAPLGVLLVDDMDLRRYEAAEHRAHVEQVRRTLVTHPGLVSVELATGTGLILSVRGGSGQRLSEGP